jgi:hypothetical protein
VSLAYKFYNKAIFCVIMDWKWIDTWREGFSLLGYNAL